MSNADKASKQAGTNANANEGADLQARIGTLEDQKQALQTKLASSAKEIDRLTKELEKAKNPPAISTPVVTKKGTHIRVAALSDGYFRGGQQFSRQPRELALDDLSKEQITAIRTDARLVVVDL